MKAYFITLLILFNCILLQATEFHGVFVGINDYNNGMFSDLPYSKKSIEQLRYAFIQHQGWNPDNLELIEDGDASEQNIKNAISLMPRSKGYTCVFSFVGHGKDGDGGGLLCVNNTFFTPPELQNEFGTNYNQFCCILDACNAGIFKYHDSINSGVILASCDSDEKSYGYPELGEDGMEVFVYYLVQGLMNNQADPGHLVSAEDLFNFADPQT